MVSIDWDGIDLAGTHAALDVQVAQQLVFHGLGIERLAVLEHHPLAQVDERDEVGSSYSWPVASCGTICKFGPMSNSLSHMAAKTMRPT